LLYLLVRSAGRTEVHLEGDGAADPGRTSRAVLRHGVCSHQSRILFYKIFQFIVDFWHMALVNDDDVGFYLAFCTALCFAFLKYFYFILFIYFIYFLCV